MALDCLLISRDSEILRILRPVLDKLSISLEVCSGASSGQEILSTEKYDAVVVDCDDLHGGLKALQEIRKQPSNRNSVAFAILNGETTTKQAFEVGANFVLQKPIQPVNAMRCFTAAFGQMERERRRYFRVPLEMPVTLTFRKGQEVRATATNLSEGGMAIRFRGKLPRSPISYVQFTLPGTNNSMQPKADAAWADGSGRAGIRFIDVPQTSREHLERWLCAHISEAEPPSKL